MCRSGHFPDDSRRYYRLSDIFEITSTAGDVSSEFVDFLLGVDYIFSEALLKD
jgi:hypothetical protein